MLPTKDEAKKFMMRFEESNRKVAKKYFGREQLFNVDYSKYPDDNECYKLNAEDMIEIAAKLWVEQQNNS